MLTADALDAILDNERCELLEALCHVEELARRHRAVREIAEGTPDLPDS